VPLCVSVNGVSCFFLHEPYIYLMAKWNIQIIECACGAKHSASRCPKCRRPVGTPEVPKKKPTPAPKKIHGSFIESTMVFMEGKEPPAKD
jgi:hypothetical protein